MTDPASSPTIADVFHRMYMASDRKVGFSGTLAGLLHMDVDGLKALYDMPAPDPEGPDFGSDVLAIATAVGCSPYTLAELLGEWTPTAWGTSA